MSDTTRHLDVLVVHQPLPKPEKCDKAKEYVCAWENRILEATMVYSFLFCINYRCSIPPSRTHTLTQKSNKMTLLNSGPFSRLAHRPSTHTHLWTGSADALAHCSWPGGCRLAQLDLYISHRSWKCEHTNTHTHTVQSQSNDTALGHRCPTPAPYAG